MPVETPKITTAEWADIRAAAHHLGMSVAFLRKQVRLGRIPFARAGSKSLRFQLSKLDEWMQENSAAERAGKEAK